MKFKSRILVVQYNYIFFTMTTSEHIAKIRAASRQIVRELGFMDNTLASTKYSPSVVHTLLEIEKKSQMTSAQISEFLGLEKSSISRMVNKLIQEEELQEHISEQDGRIKFLTLTPKGLETVKKINTFGQLQVTSAMNQLMPYAQQKVAEGLEFYASALNSARLNPQKSQDTNIQINLGYLSGIVGRVTEMHSSFYSKNYGFGQFFESQVASGIAEFVGRLDQPCNQIWTAVLNGKIVGSVAIDGEDLGDNIAHLRWFILDDGCRGYGVGHQLLQKAIEHCDEQPFKEIHLWTFKGLDAARKLYEHFDFQLVEEIKGQQWGSQVTEQKFVRLVS